MTKTEKIKEAYGRFYGNAERHIRNDGSMSESIWKAFEIDLEYQDYSTGYFRPIELIGIENNNGWIKIENESDLPDDDDKLLYEVCLFEDGIFKRIYEVFSWQAITRIWEGTAQFYAGKISHYKAIENSKPPIY